MCSRKILKTVFCLSKTVITLLFFFVTQSYRLQVIFSSTIKMSLSIRFSVVLSLLAMAEM